MILAAILLVSVKKIVIRSQWGGLGPSYDRTAVISRRGDHFVRGRTAIDSKAVEALLNALDAPPVSEEDALGRFASQEWLDAHAADALRADEYANCSPQARQLFDATFRDRRSALELMKRYYHSWTTDDSPRLSVEIRLDRGEPVRLSSVSQRAMMLPWKLEHGETWNPDVARAIAALMPADMDNRGRLDEQLLIAALASDIRRGDEFEDFEERCRHAPLVTEIEKRQFKIERAYLSSPRFNGWLRRADLPPNLLIDVHLSTKGDAATIADAFERGVEKYLALAKPYALAHPETTFELWYQDGSSLEAVSVLQHDAVVPHDPNTRRAKAALHDAALLRDHADRSAHRHWVVMPDGKSFAWGE